MKTKIIDFGRDLLHLFYPHLCLACQEETSSYDDLLCLKCLVQLPKTNFHLLSENPFTDRFWGRVQLQGGAALYHFVKGGKTQQLVYQLKYEGLKDVGIKLGRLYGTHLLQSKHFQDIDYIIPVPLHPKKERKRGYNQSWYFAKGLAEAMKVRMNNNVLYRKDFTTTQTSKSRIERFDNVMKAFAVKNEKMVQHKHVLLVDDVITTGATLEACGLQLLQQTGLRLSMATIAFANV
ncbi:MAG: ComF family protein [Saprospiraceae bacterium]|nr:ComF family protein [Saprospiraceae bacterium]